MSKHSPKPAGARGPVTSDRPVAGPAIDVDSLAAKAFLSALDMVLVDEPVNFDFDGSISRTHARSFWIWINRDVMGDFAAIIEAGMSAGRKSTEIIDEVAPDLLAQMKAVAARASTTPETERRLTVQLGGEDVRDRLPIFMNVLRCRPLLEKARAFGKAANSLPDETALGMAIQSMPLRDPATAALLMHAVVGQIANPGRLVSSITPLAGGSSEAAFKGSGFGPLIDAILAHAQNQFAALSSHRGPFADVDLTCRALDRFHRLVRGVQNYVDLDRNGRWTSILSDMTKNISAAIEPRLREVSGDVAQSLRRSREGVDRVDSERLLAALNGVYLLAAVRECRDSLALNATFEKVWNETGQTLEVLVTRNLEAFRADPADRNAAERLDMGIKMAEIRFNPEYAEILRRARDSAEKRLGLAG